MSAQTVVFRNAYVWIDTTDLSAQVKEVSINYKSEMLDRTAMGNSTREHRGGLYDWSISITPHQAWAASVDSVLWPLVGTSAALEVRPANACSTATNPRWSGVGCLESYQPLSGAVGTLLPAPVTFQSAGDLTRSVTAS